MSDTSDWDLLQEYAKRGSETAFAELVRRHIDWVYSVALRQGRNPEMAKDIVQSAFALLARKGPGLRAGVSVGGWLFRSTCFLAKCALRAEQRRKVREEAAAEMNLNDPPEHNLLWQELAPILDQAVASLSESDRTAILLRFYEKKSLLEVSQRLGITQEAAKKRVSRAVEKLKNVVCQRGVRVGGTILATLLLERTVQAAPGALLTAIGSTPVGASGSLPTLAQEAVKRAYRSSLKLVCAGTCALLMLGLISHRAVSHHWLGFVPWPAARNLEVVEQPGTQGNTAGAGMLATNGGKPTEREGFVLRVITADDGHGIAGARVLYNEVTRSEWRRGKEMKTDAEGFCTVPLEPGLGRFDVGALKDGYVQMFYTWRADSGGPLPRVYELKLSRATSIGGHVQSAAGKPVSGADIVVMFRGTGDASAREPVSERLGFIGETVVASTDAEGNWRCAVTPPGYEGFSISIQHADYVRKSYQVGSDSDRSVSSQELWAGKAVTVLEPGFKIQGLVVDGAGNPLAGARVSFMAGMNYVQEGELTGPDGSFAMGSLASGPAKLSAWSKGLAPSLKTIEVGAETPSVVFRLTPGTDRPIRIVDEEGEPIAGAWAALDLPMPHNADLRVTTGPDGRARFLGIPEEAAMGLVVHAGAKGYYYARGHEVNAAESETVIQLRKCLRVTGNVNDAETQAPILDFKAIPCYGEDASGYDRSQTQRGQFGNYTVEFTEQRPPFRVRIEAEDYEAVTSEPIREEPGDVRQDFLLRKKDNSRNMRGQVVTTAGEPAANVDVALLTFEQGARLFRGVLKRGEGGIITRTDARGEFTFGPEPQAHTIVAADPSAGFVQLRIHHLTAPYKLQLEPWGRIEGYLAIAGKPGGNREIWLTRGFPAYRTVRESLDAGGQTRTDSAGHFCFETIAPGDYTVFVKEGEGRFFSHSTPVTVSGGQSTAVNIGGGLRVTGALVIKDGRKVDWPGQVVMASLATNMKPPMQPTVKAQDVAGRLELLDFYEHSAEWRAYEMASASFPLEVAPDGRFSAEDVRPGQYRLSVQLSAVSDTGGEMLPKLLRKPIAFLDKEVVVVGDTNENQVVDLGTFELAPK